MECNISARLQDHYVHYRSQTATDNTILSILWTIVQTAHLQMASNTLRALSLVVGLSSGLVFGTLQTLRKLVSQAIASSPKSRFAFIMQSKAHCPCGL